MRVALTICLNAEHHFKHNDYVKKMLPHFDAWCFVEGASASGGSTAWCKNISDKWQKDGHSIDGTIEYLDSLAEYKNVYLVRHEGFWKSKDEMVNSALACLSAHVEMPCMLWELDADEQWTIEDMHAAEAELIANQAKTGCFHADHYVGKNLIARGEWGEGKKLPYRRLWYWNNERFKTHEPPELESGNGKTVLLPQRFRHYAYYFEQDVRFKDEWYSGHEGLFGRWEALQTRDFEQAHISELITGAWGKTNTWIYPIEKKPRTGGKKILVISHERSGTHFLINSLAENLGDGAKYSCEEISIQQAERASQIDMPSIEPIKNQLFSYFGKDEPRIFKSHHQYKFFASYIDELIKEYHIIYIVRDGRDVMNSCFYYFNQAPANEFPFCDSMTKFLATDPRKYAFDKEYSIDPEKTFPERWANHIAGWMQAYEKISIVRYEDLESRFEATMKILSTQLGIPLKENITKPGLKSRAIFARKGKSGDWKNSFTRHDIELFDALAERTMRFLKYYPPNAQTCIESLEIKKHTVALNVIVGGDEQHLLRRFLSSFQANLFDEVVVVCTTNDSEVWAVAQEFTEKVIYFKWRNNFAAARNCAMNQTESDYIWWGDADDILPQDSVGGMEEILRIVRTNDFDYYTIKYIIERQDGIETRTIPKRPCVFKKQSGVKWKYPVHEAVTLQNSKNSSKFTGISIEHKPDKNKSSGPRNLAILEIADKNDPRMMFYYGRELIMSNRADEGLKILRKLIEEKRATAEELAYSCFDIGCHAFDAGNINEAEYYAKLGIKHSKIYAELFVLLGDIMMKKGFNGDAIAAYKQASKIELIGTLCQDVRFYKFIPAIRLSSIYFDTKQYERALWYNKLAIDCGYDIARQKQNRKKIIGAINGVLEK